ncbi:MAG: hypothetical protein ABEJ40_04415 [Haloarculaceae archaeon]
MPANESCPDAAQYEDLTMADGDVVIYDAENSSAWIQSDRAVDADEMA